MKKILINFFLISVLLACKQDSIETEISIKGASYLIDYIDIDNSLKFSDSQNYKYGTPKVNAILEYSIKNIKFDKNSTFNMTVEGSVNKNFNGTYEFINGGKILILKYACSNESIKHMLNNILYFFFAFTIIFYVISSIYVYCFIYKKNIF